MIFTITNEPSDLEGQVRVIIDTDHETALQILAAARKLDKPKTDPLLEEIKKVSRLSGEREERMTLINYHNPYM